MYPMGREFTPDPPEAKPWGPRHIKANPARGPSAPRNNCGTPRPPTSATPFRSSTMPPCSSPASRAPGTIRETSTLPPHPGLAPECCGATDRANRPVGGPTAAWPGAAVPLAPKPTKAAVWHPFPWRPLLLPRVLGKHLRPPTQRFGVCGRIPITNGRARALRISPPLPQNEGIMGTCFSLACQAGNSPGVLSENSHRARVLRQIVTCRAPWAQAQRSSCGRCATREVRRV